MKRHTFMFYDGRDKVWEVEASAFLSNESQEVISTWCDSRLDRRVMRFDENGGLLAEYHGAKGV